jgi:hypothetical protein
VRSPDIHPPPALETVCVDGEVAVAVADVPFDVFGRTKDSDVFPVTLLGVVVGRQAVAAKPKTTTKRDALGRKRI